MLRSEAIETLLRFYLYARRRKLQGGDMLLIYAYGSVVFKNFFLRKTSRDA
jgi:hypothetical protein